MSYASSLPYAVDALVAMLKAQPGLSEALVNDGEGLTDSEWPDVVCVGYVPEDTDDTAAEGEAEVAGLGPDSESYSIHCGIGVLIGDEDSWADARSKACSYLEIIGQALTVDPRVRGTVARARISTWSLRQDETDAGAFARLRFDVHVDAFTRR